MSLKTMIEYNHMVNTGKVQQDFLGHYSLLVVVQRDKFSWHFVIHHPIVRSTKNKQTEYSKTIEINQWKYLMKKCGFSCLLKKISC
jgi:hypothetical protein